MFHTLEMITVKRWYMEAQFLTPIQLWKDFNPVKEPIEISFVKSEELDGLVKKGAYFTSENTPDGKARIYAEMVMPDDNKKRPVVIVLGDIDNNIDSTILEYVAKQGYIAAGIDYSAIEDNREHSTQYPMSLSYAKYDNAINNLLSAEPSARESCWFVWSKAARRLLTAIEQECKADMNKIGVIGIKHGALIMWQLCAMDGRVQAAASIIGNEGMPYYNKHKYNGGDDDKHEAIVNWRAAISTEAYAKFVGCPVLITTSTNNNVSSFDRVEDIINLLPDKTKYSLLFCARLSNQITSSALITIKKWFSAQFKRAIFPDIPKLELEPKEKSFTVKIKVDESKKIRKIQLYYSYSEIDSSYRNWISIEAQKKDDYYEAEIDVYNKDVRHFIFANIIYSDNTEVSSIEKTFVPKDLGIIENTALRQRIIYDTSKGIDTFTITSDNFIIEDSNPHLAKSPMGISGITTSEGSLVTYKIGDIRCYGEEDSILQLDANSQEDREIKIVLTAVDENKMAVKYYSTAEIKGDEDWHKFSFASQDFKTDELLPLKGWDGVKKMEILDAQDMLFNNIIWV